MVISSRRRGPNSFSSACMADLGLRRLFQQLLEIHVADLGFRAGLAGREQAAEAQSQ